MQEESNDAASNPLNEHHLPVGGEVYAEGSSIAPDINEDMNAGMDETDTSSGG